MGTQPPVLVAEQDQGPPGDLQHLVVARCLHPVGPAERHPATGEDPLRLQRLDFGAVIGRGWQAARLLHWRQAGGERVREIGVRHHDCRP